MPHVEDRWLHPGRYGKGRRWRARYTDPDGKERSKLTGSYQDPYACG
jgi:hypothetical protein